MDFDINLIFVFFLNMENPCILNSLNGRTIFFKRNNKYKTIR